MSVLRVALVGAGGKGRQHLGNVRNLEGVEIAAICDPVEKLREAVAEEFGAPGRYASIEDMLGSENLDAAFVATPAHINAIAALPCLQAGVNTFLEKPPGLSLEETRGLHEAAARSGAQGMVGWNRRFEPVIRNAVEEIRGNGPIVQLVGEFHKNMTRLEDLNRFPEHLLDNFLWETPIHAIDLVRFLGGAEVVEVHSVVRRAVHDHKDVHAALVLFANGCVAQLTFNMTSTPRLERYEIHGRDVCAYIEREGVVVFKDGETRPVSKDGPDGTELEDRFFIECIREGREIGLPAANLDEAVKTMALGQRIMDGLIED